MFGHLATEEELRSNKLMQFVVTKFLNEHSSQIVWVLHRRAETAISVYIEHLVVNEKLKEEQLRHNVSATAPVDQYLNEAAFNRVKDHKVGAHTIEQRISEMNGRGIICVENAA